MGWEVDMKTKRLLLYFLMVTAFSVLFGIAGCGNSTLNNNGENIDVENYERHEKYCLEQIIWERIKKYNVNGNDYVDMGLEEKCEKFDSIIDEINKEAAEDFAMWRIHLRSDEIVFYALDRTYAGENNSYEVFLRCMDTDEIEKLIIYIENGRVIKYIRNGNEHYIMDRDIAEDFVLRRIRGRTFTFHVLESTYKIGDLYEVTVRNIDTDEIENMAVLVIEREVMGFVHDGRIHVRGLDGSFFVYGHIDESIE